MFLIWTEVVAISTRTENRAERFFGVFQQLIEIFFNKMRFWTKTTRTENRSSEIRAFFDN